MKSVIFSALLIFLLIALPVSAATIHVPDDEETIQAGIDAAEAGDSVLVADGDYEGNGNVDITINTAITILSENGPEDCILNCAQNNATNGIELQDAVFLSGFTIVGADTGIIVRNADDVNIENCVVRESSVHGILIIGSLNLNINLTSSIENDCNAAQQGIGMRVEASEGTVTNSTFNDNTTQGSGAGVWCGGSEIAFELCEFSGNTAVLYGGGLYIGTESNCQLTSCLISGNSTSNDNDQGNGGGIALIDANTQLLVDGCVIAENTTERSGGALYISGSECTMRNSFILNNEATRNGGGTLMYATATGTFFNNVFDGNSCGIDGGGTSISNNSQGEIGNCTYSNNTAGTVANNGMGGGIYMGSGTTTSILNSIIWGNQSDTGDQEFGQNATQINITNTCVDNGVDPNAWQNVQGNNVENIIEDDPAFDESEEDPNWGANGFFIEPDSPCVDAGDDDSDVYELDTHTTQTNLDVDQAEVDLGFHYDPVWFRNFGRLFGNVVDAENNEPLADVAIETTLDQDAVTDEEGFWEIEDAEPGDFDITATLEGYTPLTIEGLNVAAGRERQVNFRLERITSRLHGLVTDAVSEEPLEGVLIVTSNDQQTFTDEEGMWAIEDAVPGEFEITATLEDYEPVTLRDQVLEEGGDLEINFELSQGVGRLFGTVIDADDQSPLENALVETSLGLDARTDADGNWEIPEAPAAPFDITASFEGYISQTIENQRVEPDGELEINFGLSAPRINIDIEEIVGNLNVEDQLEVEFQISNPGGADLEWNAYTRLSGGNGIEPWELRASGDQIEGLHGVVWAEDRFYASMTTENGNEIYALGPDGDILGSFEQPSDGGETMLDLAWDGEYIWGSGEFWLFGFTPDGRERARFRGVGDVNVGLAWDTENDWLWATSALMDDPIRSFNRRGDRQAVFENPGLDIKGLAFWADDPDGYNLYTYYDAPEGGLGISKMNTENGEFMEVGVLNPEGGGTAAGATITSNYYPMNDVFISVAETDEGGRVDIWQLAASQAWMSFAPGQGIIQPDDSQIITFTFNSTGALDGLYQGEFVVEHNAFGGEEIIPVQMQVIEEPRHTTKRINLTSNWNLVSMNLQPDDENVGLLVSDLVNAQELVMVRDQYGKFYLPSRSGFTNMDAWSAETGYWILMNSPQTLTLSGTTIRSDQPIQLDAGWQIVAYYPRLAMSPENAFVSIDENLVLAKDGNGRFYSPEWDFNSLEMCRNGKGYIVNLREADELIWFGGGEEMAPHRGAPRNPEAQAEYYSVLPSTGSDMSLLATLPEYATGEIGVWVGDQLVGSGVIKDGRCGIAVRGDDIFSGDINGAMNGDDLTITWWDNNQLVSNIEVDILLGDLQYTTNSFTVVDIKETDLPQDFTVLSAFPNPFNNRTTVTYNLKEESHVTISVYDLSGRKVLLLTNETISAGIHTIEFNAENQASGVYFIQMNLGNVSHTVKTLLLR